MKLDVKPISEEVLYVNDPHLANISSDYYECPNEPLPEDNVRVYVPLDINERSLRIELYAIIDRYDGSATWKNALNFNSDIERWVERLEIYDRVRYIRDKNKGDHSTKAVEIAKLAVDALRECDGDDDTFPHNVIEELCQTYGFKK